MQNLLRKSYLNYRFFQPPLDHPWSTAKTTLSRQSNVIYYLLSIVVQFCLQTQVSSADPRDGVVLLFNQAQKVCATAFLIDSTTLVTAYHVARSVCDGDNCHAVTIIRRDGSKFELELHPKLLLPGYDLATLISAVPISGTILPLATEIDISDASVHSISFPRCGDQKDSLGTIKNKNNIDLILELGISHGSSGAPVFNNKGEVIAVATEAATLYDALLSIFSPRFFSGARASDISNLKKHEALDSQKSIQIQSDDLMTFYRENILEASGPARIALSVRFLSKVSDLAFEVKQRGLNIDSEKLFGLSLAQQLSFLQEKKLESTAHPFTTLLLLASLESSGTNRSPFHPFGTQEVESITMLLPPKNGEIFLTVARRMLQDGYEGSEFETVKYLAVLVGVAVCIMLAVAASLGAVFSLTRGGVFKKFLTTCIVLICLWPLSLFAWYWGQKKFLRTKR